MFLHESIHDDVLARIVELTAQLHTPGLPTDMRTTMGALVSSQQMDKTLSYVESAVAEGARVAHGGKRSGDPALAAGYFVEPTILANVTPSMLSLIHIYYNDAFANMTALGRVGVPDDIGPMIASLLGPANRWVNGQRIEVSGGQSI